MDQFYEMKIAGYTRHLPICRVNENFSIAGFIMFSDVELTIACAEELLKKVDVDFDYILTAEAKGIPLAYEMARQCGKKYFVGRKMTKLYMRDPVEIEVQSITTVKKQHLYLDRGEADEIRGKKVLIVDDVISTGGSLRALEQLVETVGGTVSGKCAVLAEGDAQERTDIYFLEPLPLLP